MSSGEITCAQDGGHVMLEENLRQCIVSFPPLLSQISGALCLGNAL